MGLLKMPDGTTTAIIQGRFRSEINEISQYEPFLKGKVSLIKDEPVQDQQSFEAISISIKELGERIIQLAPNIPSDASIVLKNIKSNKFLINFVASNLNIGVQEKQQLLEMSSIQEKAEKILKQMNNELQILQLKDQIENKVKVDIEKQQRDYFL